MSNTFSGKLKELRLEKELTQEKLSKLLNCSQSNICEWEKGSVEPKMSAILSMAALFEVSTDYLLGRTDDLGAPLPNPAPLLNSEERKLLDDYRGLARPLKDVLLGLIKTWQSNELPSSQSQKKNA